MIRVVIADDHAIVRHGLRRVIALALDMQVAGEAKDGQEVLACLQGEPFDLLLLDMSMPGLSGMELIRAIRKQAPQLPILVLSMYDESQFAAGAIKAGANGYLTKDSDPDAILDAIRAVAGGGNVIAPELAMRMVFEPVEGDGQGAWECLSEREFEVFLRLARGCKVNDIATEFGLSPKTVSTHKSRIMNKIGVNSISELIHYAYQHKLIEQAQEYMV